MERSTFMVDRRGPTIAELRSAYYTKWGAVEIYLDRRGLTIAEVRSAYYIRRIS